jgi:hypothetical protein
MASARNCASQLTLGGILDFDFPRTGDGFRDRETAQAQPFNVKLDGLCNQLTRLVQGFSCGHTSGKVRDVSTPI